ncbi:ThiS family protein [uncultured archaeon]|nr:ThiS family protein [uncultured archaeon]
MIVTLDGEKTRAAFDGGPISELVRLLGLQREEVLVKVNGKLAPEDAKIGAKDKIEIIKVVFGG